jgi:hypothetical protein
MAGALMRSTTSAMLDRLLMAESGPFWIARLLIFFTLPLIAFFLIGEPA